MRGGIDFEHVDVAALGNLDTRLARAARIGRRPLHAVQRAGEDARGRRLADASGTSEDERLREPIARERVAQRPCHRLLADDIVELLRPPFSRDHLVGHFQNFRFQNSDFRLLISDC